MTERSFINTCLIFVFILGVPLLGHATDFFKAVNDGAMGVVKQSVSKEADLNIKNAAGLTVLLVSAIKGHTDIAGVLLDNGADPNIANVMGWTPLMYAGLFGNDDLAKKLINHGADINSIDLLGGATALILAVAQGKAEVTKTLLDNGADFTIKDVMGMTPLKSAQARGYSNIVQILKKAGAVE